MAYNHQLIEQKWQAKWQKNQTFKANLTQRTNNFYALSMFPYPSGSGLHVGHIEGYTATDIVARYKWHQGYNVLQPMGWDAFGLPAEQYALQTGSDPNLFTDKNIATYKSQIERAGIAIDWNQELKTTDPNYYKWTQWIFTKLYERGLAELRDIEVNWCEGLQTVLANEEILNIDGKMVSERGHFPVVKRPMRQWVLKITEYAERLLDGLDDLEWPESVKEMQRNWIGKSEGAEVIFKVADHDASFTVFTTRSDTLFGATYCVLAPEHPLIKTITTNKQESQVLAYIDQAQAKSDLERTSLAKTKTGVFTGAYAINPVNHEQVPIWISDYVLMSYGTGAIMAVPAHDSRDYEFATQFKLPIIPVLEGGDVSQEAYLGDGVHINSGFLNGLNKEDAIAKMNAYLEANQLGKASVNYKLRDWIFSRQRYWGEPFPVIYHEDGSLEVLSKDQLPVKLPILGKITSTKSGESPLANATDWLYVNGGRRETNTMPQWAGSCWYYLGYLIKDGDEFLDFESPETQARFKAWLPVDIYIGGAEHAVLHLLYARFWHKVLYDLGLVPTDEPFKRLFNQGMILGENGVVMSKSLGNVVNPDEIFVNYGADTLRAYEMFMGPLEAVKPWSTTGIEGPRRFLERVWRLYTEQVTIGEATPELTRVYHETVAKVTEDYEALAFNTALSQMMIFINECYKTLVVPREYLVNFLILLNPIAPHLTEELNEVVLESKEFLAHQPWPTFDPEKLIVANVTVVIQVNGKIRDKVEVPADCPRDQLETLALSSRASEFISGPVKRIVVVPNKLVNIVN